MLTKFRLRSFFINPKYNTSLKIPGLGCRSGCSGDMFPETEEDGSEERGLTKEVGENKVLCHRNSKGGEQASAGAGIGVEEEVQFH
jgi:hypothetical protein